MPVYLFHGLIPCLPFFHGQDISFCNTTSRKLMFYFTRGIFLFYIIGRNVRFFFLAFFTHACLLISRTGIARATYVGNICTITVYVNIIVDIYLFIEWLISESVLVIPKGLNEVCHHTGLGNKMVSRTGV